MPDMGKASRPTVLGDSSTVEQRTLTPSIFGSNPGPPANENVDVVGVSARGQIGHTGQTAHIGRTEVGTAGILANSRLPPSSSATGATSTSVSARSDPETCMGGDCNPPPTDSPFMVSGRWALASDGAQWILQRRRGAQWQAVSFVRSTKDILARCMREKGVPAGSAARLLEQLPASFDRWLLERSKILRASLPVRFVEMRHERTWSVQPIRRTTGRQRVYCNAHTRQGACCPEMAEPETDEVRMALQGSAIQPVPRVQHWRRMRARRRDRYRLRTRGRERRRLPGLWTRATAATHRSRRREPCCFIAWQKAEQFRRVASAWWMCLPAASGSSPTACTPSLDSPTNGPTAVAISRPRTSTRCRSRRRRRSRHSLMQSAPEAHRSLSRQRRLRWRSEF